MDNLPTFFKFLFGFVVVAIIVALGFLYWQTVMVPQQKEKMEQENRFNEQKIIESLTAPESEKSKTPALTPKQEQQLLAPLSAPAPKSSSESAGQKTDSKDTVSAPPPISEEEKKLLESLTAPGN